MPPTPQSQTALLVSPTACGYRCQPTYPGKRWFALSLRWSTPPCKALEIDLMADSRPGRNQPEIIKGGLTPSAGTRAPVAFELALHIGAKGSGRIRSSSSLDRMRSHHRLAKAGRSLHDRHRASTVASRIAVRISTTAGTPVICMSTRAGWDAISRSEARVLSRPRRSRAHRHCHDLTVDKAHKVFEQHL